MEKWNNGILERWNNETERSSFELEKVNNGKLK